MTRSAVRFVQVFISVFLGLSVLTASLRTLTADGADHSASSLLQIALGDALVLFVAFGLVWVLPNRLWRADTAERMPVPAIGVSERTESPHRAVSTVAAGSASRPHAVGDGALAPDLERRLLLVLLPALIILVAGIVIYFVR